MCYINKSWAVSSAVERLPYKQDATGSNPVPPIYQIIYLLVSIVFTLSFFQPIEILSFR